MCIAFFFAPISIYKNGTTNINSGNAAPGIVKYDLQGLKKLNLQSEEIISSVYAIPMIVMVIGGIAFLSILFFKRRSLQMRLIKFDMVLNVVLLLMLVFYVEREVRTITHIDTWSATYLVGMYFPIVTLFLLYLAHVAIKKDDELVKSSDRLR